ncbi:hypothetical protein SA3033_00270 [Aggregatibacter actinomycetemcomitans serotype d str. SA3033]|nr:hypothetical protein SA2876_11065 [Aggregatibacter actinomycetemcomitans serotype e str. SA2876]KYK84576.1 hypothetical protein SA508_09850 [Aggregatibacter actinomycetemcomitans serotype d str. SA508]KYK85075.1 hypothetical protein SA3033_00270 [Aggregatibacter actinomycetemcomitans serotype d str. SA3033]KYK85942.1 hypothetical protein SC29R_10545 [Aggregatibacter actinomycetemcomitans serotype f str. SC29R]KYK89960.1 hypothetical protein SA2200_01580 [Aggregatibacter actinomycetemcomitans
MDNKEEINQFGEFLPNIRIEKMECLKLIKRFSQLANLT